MVELQETVVDGVVPNLLSEVSYFDAWERHVVFKASDRNEKGLDTIVVGFGN